MATNKPRITVTLTDHQHALLKAISSSSGQSMSSIVSDYLGASEPAMEFMASSFQKLKAINDQQKNRFSESLEKAQASLEPLALSCLKEFDGFLDAMHRVSSDKNEVSETVKPSERGAKRASVGRVKSAAVPPLTNRGVQPCKRKPRKAAPVKV